MAIRVARLGLLVLFVAGLMVGRSADAAVVAHWSFDEGTGTSYADSSGNGYHGTAQSGTAVTHVAGKFGNAAKFNGTSNAWISTPHIPFLSGSFTVSVWVNIAAFSPQNTIFSDWSSPFSFRFFVDANQTFAFQARNTDAVDLNNTGGPIRSTSTLTANTWYHLAAVWDSDTATMRLYLNGELNQEVVITKTNRTIIDNNRNYGIGIKQDSTDRFNGSLDELWVFDTALGANEIRSLLLSNAIPEPTAAAAFGLSGMLVMFRRRR